MALYLVYVDLASPPELTFDGAHFELRPGLYLVETDSIRSRLYHDVKHQLPADTPLLAAPLADAPKFKGMASGALAWVRDGLAED